MFPQHLDVFDHVRMRSWNHLQFDNEQKTLEIGGNHDDDRLFRVLFQMSIRLSDESEGNEEIAADYEGL